ncbi:MAG: TerC/Alx family metal homeostasis membrane protein [Plesiomonas sp.]
MLNPSFIYWALGATLLVSLYLDFVGHKGKEMTLNSAINWSAFFVGVGIMFGGFIHVFYGSDFASKYFAGYLLEKALSVDNLLVFTAIFTSFGITCKKLQHKILLWGIAGAILFRGLFVAAGTQLMQLHWSVMVVFAAIIVWSATKMLTGSDDDEVDYTQHKAVKVANRLFKVTPTLMGDKFFHKDSKGFWITPALICLFVVELSDVMFAFDSVPAIFAVTTESVLVYSSMILAICGLRSMYFVLKELLEKLPNLEKAVIGLLYLVAAKLVGAAFGFHIDPVLSLSVVVGILALGCIPSKKA